MKKVIIILIIVVVAIVILGGVFVYKNYFMQQGSKINILSSKSSNVIIHENQLTPAEISKKEAECKNIQNSNDQNACYGNLAIDANDPSICQSFGSAICKYFNFMWHTNLCNNITINKPVYGLNTDDAVIQDLNEKEECIENIAINSKNKELCGNLFEEASEDCQTAIAVALTDPDKSLITKNGAVLAATPTSGTAPLGVTFLGEIDSKIWSGPIVLDFGELYNSDGFKNNFCSLELTGTQGSNINNIGQHYYLYKSPGTYVAKLRVGENCIYNGCIPCTPGPTIGTITIIVKNR